MVYQKVLKTKYFRLAFEINREAARVIQRAIRNFISKKKSRLYLQLRRRVLGILDGAWVGITEKHKDSLQLYLRHLAFLSKNAKAQERVRAQISKRLLNNYFKGSLEQLRLNRMHRAAFTIQGYVKMKWLKELLARLRKACVVIQRAWRKYFYRKTAESQALQLFYSPYLARAESLKGEFNLFLFSKGRSPFERIVLEE
jgi:hypothetical protein